MWTTKLALVWAAAACGCALATAFAAQAPATIELFNGTSLAGWRAVSAKPGTAMEAVWSVRDGVIVCKGEPMGYIHTERHFTNFLLTVEWRWTPGKKPGNSGVFLRINGEPKALPRCIECQLKSGDAGDVYGFHGMKIDGDKARKVEKKGHELGGDLVGVRKRFRNENPPGQWNRFEIELRGGLLKIKVNGTQVNEAVGCEMTPGPVGLQSEGGEIQFRRVRITPLDS